MTTNNVTQYFSDREIEEFNSMLKLYIRNNLLRAILKELKNSYGKSSQMLFWNLTSSKIWSELCKYYGLDVTNKALHLFVKQLMEDNKALIEILKGNIKRYALITIVEKINLLDAHINIEELEKLMQEIE